MALISDRRQDRLTSANILERCEGTNGSRRAPGDWWSQTALILSLTGDRRRTINETVRDPKNRGGAKLADARLAELIPAVESGRYPDHQEKPAHGLTVGEIAKAWQEANRPRQDRRSGDWLGWSPKTTKTVGDNFRHHILPVIGTWNANNVTGVHLDRLYLKLEQETGLSPTVILRCHGQVRAMFNWAVRKRMASGNPALAADPPPREVAPARGSFYDRRPGRPECFDT